MTAVHAYTNNGFVIEIIDADLEFSSIEFRVIVDGYTVPFNILDVDLKNHPAERSIRVVKERVRCTLQSLPFSCIPKGIIVSAVYEAIEKINRLPRPRGISSTLSPLTIVTNTAKLDFNLLKLEFGEYVEVYEDN